MFDTQATHTGALSDVARNKLDGLEQMLWQGYHLKQGLLSRIYAQTVSACIALALKKVALHLSNTEIKYLQNGDPGPGSTLQGQDDAVLINIRTARVEPYQWMRRTTTGSYEYL